MSINNTKIDNVANAIKNKVAGDVSAHNTNNTAHADIRQDISDLNTLIGDAITYINL